MSDTSETLNRIQTAFNEFKATNDARLKDIETKGSADVVTNEKLDAINETITELEKKMARPSNVSAADQANDEYKSAWNAYARKGIDAGLSELEAKAMTLAVSGDGGIALPKFVEAGLYEQLEVLSPIRSLATVVNVTGDDYRFLSNAHGLTSGWVGETDARPETATPTLTETRVPMGELYANPAVSQRALDDLAFDVEAFIAKETAREFAIQENRAFVAGDGVNKPQGILTTTGITTIKTGFAAAMPTSADYIYQMVYGLGAAYRTGASFIASSATIAGVRTLKDTTGNYIWQPSLVAGAPSQLAGYNVVTIEDMPTVAANALPLAFGNIAAGYLVADRIGIRTIRDNVTKKPFVLFYSTKRVGGMVRDKAAFVFLKVST